MILFDSSTILILSPERGNFMIITGNGQLIHQNLKSDFPTEMGRKEYHAQGPILKKHWHEELMIFYIEKGIAVIHCNSQSIPVSAGDLVITNCNDIHYQENCCNHLVESYILIDLTFLLSHKDDICQTKYITPLLQNRICFQNKIENDNELISLVLELINEYEQKKQGYELWIKAGLYRILVLLIQRYAVPVADKIKNRPQYQLRPVIKYVDEHYDQKITLKALATMANISPHHLCRLFKSITGMPPIVYVNYLRINAAMALLQEHHLSVSEVALTVGFNDSNYFSRLFKKYKKISPTAVRKS
jgi:AraC-like DNA-binding protein